MMILHGFQIEGFERGWVRTSLDFKLWHPKPEAQGIGVVSMVTHSTLWLCQNSYW
jgi:hypothetical protein